MNWKNTIVMMLAATAAVQVARAEAPARFDAPFAFRTPSAVMPAGQYEVEVRPTGGSARLVLLRHLSTKTGNIFVTSANLRSTATAPAIHFQCSGGDDCRLEQVTLASGTFGAVSEKRPNEKRYTIFIQRAPKPNAE
ncbi:MAG: hypothetical protein JNK48_21755 [Bryobacterales bacterium]|nr:hypothetical protein [Bryobacterales bacterium]